MAFNFLYIHINSAGLINDKLSEDKLIVWPAVESLSRNGLRKVYGISVRADRYSLRIVCHVQNSMYRSVSILFYNLVFLCKNLPSQ